MLDSMAETDTSLREDFILKYLPFLGGLIILFSLTKAIVYYNVFGIRILDFIDFSEAILIFLDDILLMGGITLLQITVLLSVMLNPSLKDGNISPRRVRRLQGAFFIGFIIFVSSAYLIQEPLKIALRMIVLNFIIYSIVLLILYVFQLVAEKYEVNRDKTRYRVYWFALFINTWLLGYLILSGYGKGLRIVKQVYKGPFCVLFLKDNRKVMTGPSLYYIGKTNNFLFFYNPNSKVNTAIPMSDVLEMKFSSKSKF